MSYEKRKLEFAEPLTETVARAHREIFLNIPNITEHREKTDIEFARQIWSTGELENPRNESEGYEFRLGKCIGYIGEERICPYSRHPSTGKTGKKIIILERGFSRELEEIAMNYIAVLMVRKNYVVNNSYPQPEFRPHKSGRASIEILVTFDASEDHAEQSAFEIVKVAHAIEKSIRYTQQSF